jgi:uncharacterized coiled-coil protein SlyX
MKTKNTEKRIEWLESQPIVQYWIEFSSKSLAEQHEVIAKYEKHLEDAKSSELGKLYLDTREALRKGDIKQVRANGRLARKILASGDYAKTEPFDPAFIGSQHLVKEYRDLTEHTSFKAMVGSILT